MEGLDEERLLILFWGLRPRQRQVMYFFVQGMSVSGIAEHLEITENTVWQYLNQVKRKAEELDDALQESGIEGLQDSS